MRRKSLVSILFCFAALLLFPAITVRAEKAPYTYIYDYWGDYRESPDAYEASFSVTGESLGIGDFNEPQGMYIKGNLIYIADTGNNRIVVIEKNDEKFTVVDQFSEFTGDSDILTFNKPNDVFVAENGDFYICDTQNQRILHMNSDHQLVKELKRPKDETVDQKGDFLPTKAVADFSGRVLALVKNYNKGFVQYKSNGEFAGFIGASEAKFNMADYFWKMIATKEQRARMVQFVPTEYNNVALDKDGFVYCTTSVFEENELLSDKAKPIRKLNAQGTDILVKNGWYPPIGDIYTQNAAGYNGPTRFIDITVLDNDVYYALDMVRGRMYGYDSQGDLLYAFGGVGNRMGYLMGPIAIDHMGNDLIVLDQKTMSFTIFTLTQYGKLINDALDEYKQGNYDVSAEYWKKVLMQNGNYDIAYTGIGRSLFRQKKYKESMEYFDYSKARKNLSKAFQLYRKEWIEQNIQWIVIIFIALIVVPNLIGLIKRIKREVDRA
jgi:tetratricopeptide (TPR) repeat protein